MYYLLCNETRTIFGIELCRKCGEKLRTAYFKFCYLLLYDLFSWLDKFINLVALEETRY